MRGWSVSVQVQPDVSCFQAPGQITANSTSMVGVHQTQGCRTTYSYDLYLWCTMKLFFSKETLSGILIKTTKQNKTRGKELPSTSLNYHCLRSISIAVRPSQLKGKIWYFEGLVQRWQSPRHLIQTWQSARSHHLLCDSATSSLSPLLSSTQCFISVPPHSNILPKPTLKTITANAEHLLSSP